MPMKIYVVGNAGADLYTNWLRHELGCVLVSDMINADLVMFTGGEDVSPSVYGEKAHPRTHSSPGRDDAESVQFIKAYSLSKKMIGICRGSQFLCAKAGGKLVQDQENPQFSHGVSTYDGKHITVTSTHHQAMWPWNLGKDEWKLIAWSKDISKFHEGGNRNEMVNEGPAEGREVEMAYFKEIDALGIQGHPEMVYYSTMYTEFINYCVDLVVKHMNGEFK